MNTGSRLQTLLAVAAALAAFAPPALAYLDPSTGSMILSAIVGLAATGILAVKTSWYKLKSLFTRSRDTGAEPARRGEAEKPAD